MIYETQNQINNILIFIFCGILFGIFSIIYFSLFLKNYQKKLIKIIFDTIFYAFFTIFFVFLINFFNLGCFSFVLLLTFTCGFLWSKSLTQNLVVILEKRWYTIVNKTFTKLKLKFKRRNKKKNELTKKS